MIRRPTKITSLRQDVSYRSGFNRKRTVWLVYGVDVPISRPLKDEIEKHFNLYEEIPLEGPYHSSILRYRPSGRER